MDERTVKDVLLARLEELESVLDDYTTGSDEYNKIMTEIHKVTNDLNEIAKVEVEAEKIYYQQDKDRKDRLFRGIETGSKMLFVGGIVVLSLYFEKEDSFSSTVGRAIVRNIVPKF